MALALNQNFRASEPGGVVDSEYVFPGDLRGLAVAANTNGVRNKYQRQQ